MSAALQPSTLTCSRSTPGKCIVSGKSSGNFAGSARETRPTVSGKSETPHPPYLGSRYIAQEHGYDYVNKLYARFPGVPKMADFCTHWFRLAHDALPDGGRAGLVGTNTIRQNEGREASLDHVAKNGGTITEAVSTQVWSGDAQVHVSIVNWVKGREDGIKKLYTQHGDSVEGAWKIEDLPEIAPTLSSKTDVSEALDLAANQDPKRCFQGQNPVNAGFFLEPTDAKLLLTAHPNLKDVIFPYMIGDDLVGHSQPTRWIIDFAKRDQFESRAYAEAFEHVQKEVMPKVLERAEKEKAATGKDKTRWTRMAERWWQFRDYQPGLMSELEKLPRYIACSRTTRRPIFDFISTDIHPDTKLAVITLADDYSFGIISSGVHWEWVVARCSTWKADFNYTGNTVFDTFPWPQSPTRKQIEAVAEAAVALRALRREIMAKLDYSLRDLYRTLEEPGANPLRDAHTKLDTAVRAAYAMPKDADILAFLLALNHDLAAKEKAGQKITPPGLLLPPAEHAAFITEDCIRVPA